MSPTDMPPGTRTSSYSPDQARALVDSVGFWWHSIDLGNGVITRGEKTAAILARELKSLRIPDLAGKSVLDIGAYDGFYSFEAERRGARRVVSLDHFVWSLDLPAHIAYVRDCRAKGRVPLPYEQTPHWQPDLLPGKRGFDTARTILGSAVEPIVGDYMTIDVDAVGMHDVVFYMGVLYHMENPLTSLRRLAAFTRELAIIETHAVVVPGFEGSEICEFYSTNQLNADVSNWWGPNLKALEGMCRAAGFSRVEVISGYNDLHRADGSVREGAEAAARYLIRRVRRLQPIAKKPLHFRAVVHAWK